MSETAAAPQQQPTPDTDDQAVDPRFAGETLASCSADGAADPDGVSTALAVPADADAGPVADEADSPQQDEAVGA